VTEAQQLPATGEAATGGTLGKGLAVLQLVAEQGAVTVAEVGRGVGLSRSSAYRLVDRLRAGGYLQEAASAGLYRLGPRVVPIGLAALNQMDVMDVAPARLLKLAEAAGETVNLAVPERDQMVFIYQAEGPGAVKVTAHLGTRRPLNCSSLGKALLASLPPGELEERLPTLRLVALTPNSIVDADALRAELEATTRRGYSIDDEEVEAGVACFGAAIRDYTGRPIAAISIAGPAERMPGKRAEVTASLLAAADDISRRLGYQR
jgi:IclR family acetate operon transcriptional repressor